MTTRGPSPATGPPPRVLHVLRDPPLDGPTNMARDEHLLQAGTLGPAAVRIYGWDPPTISLGCFQRHRDLDALPPELRRLPVVRRMTGGGAILHDREVTYGLTLDDTLPVARAAPLELYRLVHRCWHDALAPDSACVSFAPEHLPLPTPRSGPFFCFEKPGRTDLLLGTRKLLGSAQRRIPGRVLQHGSLLLGRRFPAHPGADLGQPDAERVERWIAAFLARLAAALGLPARPAAWSAAQLADVAQRRARYASEAWTRRL